MRVRLLTDRAGAAPGAYWPEGTVVELDRGEALALIRSGSAERADDEPERATVNPHRQPRKKSGRSKTR